MAQFERGRTKFECTVVCDTIIVEDLMKQFIEMNNLKEIVNKKTGERCYRLGDNIFSVYKFFKYTIEGQNVTVYSWYKDAFGREMKIHKAATTTEISDFMNSLIVLLLQLQKYEVQPQKN